MVRLRLFTSGIRIHVLSPFLQTHLIYHAQNEIMKIQSPYL
jgi:hypothetical protein